MIQRAPYILLVDDNEADARLNEIALLNVDPTVRIVHIWSGPKAIEYLREAKKRQDWPDLMFLDFNMPEMTGPELIHTLTEEELNHFPIYIFSGMLTLPSEEPLEVAGATACIEKPMTYPSTVRLFEEMLKPFQVSLIVSPSRMS